MQRALLFFIHIASCITTVVLCTTIAVHASEIEEYIDIAFTNEYCADAFLRTLSPEQIKYTERLRQSLELGLVQKQVLDQIRLFQVTGTDAHYKNKKVSFKKHVKRVKGDKEKRAFVARWTLTLDSAQALCIREDRPENGYFYQYLSLNGRVLTRDSHGCWLIPGNGSLSSLGKKGKNTIIAVSGIANNTRIQSLSVSVGVLTDEARSLAKQLINTSKTDKENGSPLYTLGRLYAQHKELIDGDVLAHIFIAYFQAQGKGNKQDPKYRTQMLDTARAWMGNIQSNENIYFYQTIKKKLPSWLHEGVLFDGKRYHEHTMNALVRSYAQNSSESDFATDLITVLKKIKLQCQKAKITLTYFNKTIFYGVTDTLPKAGFFQNAMDMSTLVDDPKTLKRMKRNIEINEQRLQTKAQLSGNPEALQYYAEFQTMLRRGAEDKRAVDSVVSIFRKAGNKLIVDDLSMRSLSVEMLYEMSKDSAFHQHVINRAQIQFDKRAQQALAKGNLDSIHALISSYALLIDTDQLHVALLNEYMDRCAYNRARYHALHLIESKKIDIAVIAAVKLLVIENALGLSRIERTRFSQAIKKSTCTIAGHTQTFTALQKSMHAEPAPVTQIQSPGPVIAQMALGIPHGADVNGPLDLRTAQTYYDKQVVEPLFTGSGLICSSPSYIRSLDIRQTARQTAQQKTIQHNKLLWAIEQGPASTPPTNGYTSKQHYAELINNNIALLWSHPDSHAYTIRAYSQNGELAWDMSDSPENQRWTPICTPHSAFGRLFTLVYDNTVPNQFQINVAILNGSNGAIEKLIALNTVFATNKFERGIAGLHFTHTKDALYGVSGSGVVFKLNRKSLNLDWANGSIYRNISNMHTPSAFIKVFTHNTSDIIVSHMPAMQEWHGVSARSGRVIWRSINSYSHYIHSRNSDTMLITSGYKDVLCRVDPHTGRTLWRAKAYGIHITGEGSVVNDVIHLPCTNGYAQYNANNGEFISFTNLPQTINKIRVDNHAWYFFSAHDVFVCKQGGSFKGSQLDTVSNIYNEKVDSKKPQVLRNTADLIPSTILPNFGDPRFKIKAERTSLPYYFLLKKERSNNIVLFREGHIDDNNIYQADKSIWIETAANHRVIDDILITFDTLNFKAVRLPNKEMVAEGSIKSLKLSKMQIIGVTKIENSLIIIADSRRGQQTIISFNIQAGEEQRRYNIEGGSVLFFDRERMIYRHKKKGLLCLETSTGIQKWQTQVDKQFGDRYALTSIAPDHFIIGKNPMQTFSLSTGEATSVIFKREGWASGTAYADGKIFIGSGNVIDAKSGKRRTDVKRVLVAPGVGAAVLYNDTSFYWYDQNGSIKLDTPHGPMLGRLQNGWKSTHADFNNKIIYIFTNTCILSYDRSNGEIISSRMYPGATGEINTVLNDSIIMSEGTQSFIMHHDKEKNAALRLAHVSNPDNAQWPQDGWAKPQQLNSKFWIASSQSKSNHKYAMQFAEDDNNYYLHLYCSPLHDAQTERILKTTLAYGKLPSTYFEIKWNLDRTPEATANLSNIGLIKSRKRIDRKGNIHCYLTFDRRHLEKNKDFYPHLNINISEYHSGVLDGTYLFGGLASLKYYNTFGSISSQSITNIKNDVNFDARKEIYDTSNNIIPQGSDLARWVQTYRGLHGHKKTIEYLKAMLIRCKKSTISVNILSCLLSERLKQWSRAHPYTLEVSETYRSARRDIITELKKFADNTGIDHASSEYGLTLIAVETFPYNFQPEYFYSLATRGTPKHRAYHSTRLQPHAPFNIYNTYRPHVAHHFIGSFNVTAPVAIGGISFSSTLTAFGAIEYISPSKNITFIGRDGTLSHGCTGIKDYKEKIRPLDKLDVMRMPYNDKNYQAVDYHTGGRSRFVKIDDLMLPALKQNEFSKKDLLVSLENLPSDSTLGDDLCYKYQPKPEESEKLWELVVRQTSPDLYNQASTEGALDALMKIYIGKKTGLARANTMLKDVMKKYRVQRNIQRKLFLKHNNSIVGSERWFNLGAFMKSPEQTLNPLPETVENVFDQKFTYGDKDYNFTSSTKKMPRGQWGCTYHLDNITKHEAAISYHYSSFDLRENKKVFLYFGQHYSGRYGLKVTVWIDGEEVGGGLIGHSSGTPIMFPVRLKRGNHKILIGVDYQRGWDLTFHIGDVTGMPLETVEFAPAIALD